jgi:hypothetical protein
LKKKKITLSSSLFFLSKKLNGPGSRVHLKICLEGCKYLGRRGVSGAGSLTNKGTPDRDKRSPGAQYKIRDV